MDRLKVKMMHIFASRDYFIRSGAKWRAPLQVMGSRSRVHLSCTYARGNWIGTTKIQRENYKKINKTMEISEVQGNACFTNKDLVTCLQKYSFPVVAQQMQKTRSRMIGTR